MYSSLELEMCNWQGRNWAKARWRTSHKDSVSLGLEIGDRELDGVRADDIVFDICEHHNQIL